MILLLPLAAASARSASAQENLLIYFDEFSFLNQTVQEEAPAPTDHVDPRCDGRFRERITTYDGLSKGTASLATFTLLSKINSQDREALRAEAKAHPDSVLPAINRAIDEIIDHSKRVDRELELVEGYLSRRMQQVARGEPHLTFTQIQKILDGLEIPVHLDVEYRNGVEVVEFSRRYKDANGNFHADRRAGPYEVELSEKIVKLENETVYKPNGLFSEKQSDRAIKVFIEGPFSVTIENIRTKVQALALHLSSKSRLKLFLEGLLRLRGARANLTTGEKPATTIFQEGFGSTRWGPAGGAAAIGLLGVGSNVAMGMTQSAYPKNYLKKCEYPAERAEEISRFVTTDLSMGPSPDCSKLSFDVPGVLSAPTATLSLPGQTPSFAYNTKECGVLLNRLAELEKRYSNRGSLELNSCNQPAVVKDDSGAPIGTFAITPKGEIQFEQKISGAKDDFGMRIRVTSKVGAWDFDPETIECFNPDGTGNGTITRPRCGDDIRTALLRVPQAYTGPVPALMHRALYTQSAKQAEASGTYTVSKPLSAFHKHLPVIQRQLSYFAARCSSVRPSVSGTHTTPARIDAREAH